MTQLIAITASMEVYFPPDRPTQTYTQGFWYGVIAAVLYLTSSMLLMVNMLGFLLGHYRERFNLTESQRTMILQTMLFFIWLAGGAGVFSAVESKYGEEGWLYSDAVSSFRPRPSFVAAIPSQDENTVMTTFAVVCCWYHMPITDSVFWSYGRF